jgi:hypothetical protein
MGAPIQVPTPTVCWGNVAPPGGTTPASSAPVRRVRVSCAGMRVSTGDTRWTRRGGRIGRPSPPAEPVAISTRSAWPRIVAGIAAATGILRARQASLTHAPTCSRHPASPRSMRARSSGTTR